MEENIQKFNSKHHKPIRLRVEIAWAFTVCFWLSISTFYNLKTDVLKHLTLCFFEWHSSDEVFRVKAVSWGHTLYNSSLCPSIFPPSPPALTSLVWNALGVNTTEARGVEGKKNPAGALWAPFKLSVWLLCLMCSFETLTRPLREGNGEREGWGVECRT